MKKRRAIMAAVAVVCAGVIAVGLSGCEWFSFDGRRKTPTSVSDTLGYYGSDTASWLTSESKSPLELRREEYEAAIEAEWFTEEELSFAEYLKTMKEDSASLSSSLRASVAIGVTTARGTGSAGSGVVYSIENTTAYVITNYHVTDGGNNFYVYFYGDPYNSNAINASNVQATYVGGSKSEDIAVLSVTIPNDRLDFVQSICDNVGTRDSDTARVGETVYAIGNPLGYGISAVSGTIGMEVEDESLVSHLSMRIDAPVTHGNSGGGLFDRDGKLLGIVYGGLDSTVQVKNNEGKWVESTISITGFGWAIPANRALSVAQSIIDNYKNPESADSRGTATYGLLGTFEVNSTRVEFDELTQTINIIEEVAVDTVNSGSPFTGAIKDRVLDSIVVTNNNRTTVTYKITRMHQVETILFNIRMGDTVTLHFTEGDPVPATYNELNHFSIKT